ncbi:hypothetical protein [Curtobacterium sp. RRHDQ10]|uniref:hypothetical protein n=1 Tax=Curtobacterium phyllosphaerae TaxID=3413379 RepID=UPI003BEFD0BC
MDVSPLPGPERAGTVEERTARITLRRPVSWTSDVPSGSDLRITAGTTPGDGTVSGDGTATGVVVTVRSRPSEHDVVTEHRGLLDRLPGSVDGVLVVGVDPWTTAGAPGRLVEYRRPTPAGDTLVTHLLLATGRHRVDLLVERPLALVATTDDEVFRVLDSVRVVGTPPAPTVARTDTAAATPEALPPAPVPPSPTGPSIDDEALATLQGMAGRRWNPGVLRTQGGRTLIDRGLVGRFGTVPAATSAILGPWAADVVPLALEQRGPSGAVRLRAWIDGDHATVLDGAAAAGEVTESAVASVDRVALVALLAGRLGTGPTWTVPFRTTRLGAALLERRLAAGADLAPLPADVRSGDPVLARLWDQPWTVSSLRRPGRPHPVTIVRAADGVFARVGRTSGADRAFRVEAPANLYRLLVRTVLED